MERKLKGKYSSLSIFQVKEYMNTNSQQSTADHIGNLREKMLKYTRSEPILLRALRKMLKIMFITIYESEIYVATYTTLERKFLQGAVNEFKTSTIVKLGHTHNWTGNMCEV